MVKGRQAGLYLAFGTAVKFFMRLSLLLSLLLTVKMNSMIYAWLCSLTAAFGGFMWGYEVG